MIAVLALSLGLVSPLDSTKMIILFNGSTAGENTCEWSATQVISKTTLSVATTTLKSDLTLNLKDGKIVNYTITNDQNQTKTLVEYKDGKVIATVNGTPRPAVTLQIEVDSFIGNLHPQTLRTVLKKVGEKPKAKISSIFLDSAAKFDLEVESLRPRAVNGQQVSTYKLKLGPTEVEYAMNPNGTVVGMEVTSQKLRFVATGWESVYVDPLAKYKELSQPTFTPVVQNGRKAAMRDGVNLVSDVYLPAADGKFPVILMRTPYDRKSLATEGEFYAKRGYAVVLQDVRGREESDGEWNPFMPERRDGYDTLDWIAKQPWCDGNVGMIGASYGGLVQWAAAVEGHPALKCIVPQVSPPSAFENIPYEFGVPMLWSSMWWLNLVKDKKTRLDLAVQPLKNPQGMLALPLPKVDDQVFGRDIPQWNEWMKRQTAADYPGFDFLKDIPKVKIPAMHISGWWDGDGIGTKLNWQAARSGGNNRQWLIYGPWTHAFNTTSTLGDVNYGKHAILELDSVYLRWFDTWLKGKEVGQSKVPKVQVFVTGLNKWRTQSDWPDGTSKKRTLFLGRTGGSLTLSQKSTTSTPAKYTYDPAKDTVPPMFSNLSMATEPSTKVDLPKGEGTLLFRSQPMTVPTTVGGPLEVDLHFSTSAKDTDFFTAVVDIKPNGEIRAIGMSGKVRASYLGSMSKRTPLTPGKAYAAKIKLWDLCHQFGKGHRMGLMISSSQFPMYARNLGTAEPNATATKMVAQRNQIFMDPKRPSRLTYMVLP
ncbi:MAG TPA: CocE/NonD family hydrolase [Fimbriimonadaceae bacterium]|nr:CocE/NonD family hydrolase [Fimbriimonadaceae bacterium]